MAIFDVNNKEVIKFTAKLERLHRSSFPSAVRNTLNEAAFNMKKTGLIDSAKKKFSTVRSPTFFKKFSLVSKAEGFNINGMVATVGFSNSSDQKIKNVIDGLEKHEWGGMIGTGSRYLKASRAGSNYGKRVSRAKYFSKGNVIQNGGAKKGTRKSRYTSILFAAKKDGRAVFIKTSRGSFLVRVQSIRKAGKRLKTDLKFLMMSRSKTPVKIRRNMFVSAAAKQQARLMDKYYKKHAEFQFNKALK